MGASNLSDNNNAIEESKAANGSSMCASAVTLPMCYRQHVHKSEDTQDRKCEHLAAMWKSCYMQSRIAMGISENAAPRGAYRNLKLEAETALAHEIRRSTPIH